MQFYANLIYENADKQRVRFSSIGKMLNLKADRKLPSHRNERDLANSFVDFFIDKVQRIRMKLPFATVSSCLNTCPGFSLTSVQELCSFSPTSVNELSSLLKTTSSKSCVLEPIPVISMTECYDALLPVITHIVNLSFYHCDCTYLQPSKKELLTPYRIKGLYEPTHSCFRIEITRKCEQ